MPLTNLGKRQEVLAGGKQVVRNRGQSGDNSGQSVRLSKSSKVRSVGAFTLIALASNRENDFR